jgi:hypothetical protein
MRAITHAVVAAAALAVSAGPPGPVALATQAELALFDISGGPRGRGSVAAAKVLDAPPGARVFPGGRAANRVSFESDVRLETSLRADQIASHYIAQIESPEWRVAARHGTDTLLDATRLAGTAPSGDPLTVVLTVTRLDGERNDVALRIVSPNPAGQSGRAVNPPAARQAQSADPLPRLSGEAGLLRDILLADGLTSRPGERFTMVPDLPAGFPNELMPPGAKFGVAAIADRDAAVVSIAPELSLSAASRFIRDLATAGWIDQGPPVGGFVRPQFVYATLCRGRQSAGLRFVRRDAGGTYVRAIVSSNACERMRPAPFGDVAMPVLVHPSGAAAQVVTAGGGLESHRWHARIGSGLSWPDLTNYYAGEMARSSWQPEFRVADDDILVSVHRSSTRSGEPVVAILTLLHLPNRTTTDAWLRVVRTRATPGGRISSMADASREWRAPVDDRTPTARRRLAPPAP